MQPQSVSPDLPRLHAAVVAVAMLLALVGLADLMVWQVTTPRLGLALLALSITAAAYLRAGPAIGHRAAMCGWVGMGLATLPVIEEVQSLSVLFLIMGVIHAAGWFVVGSSAAWALAIRASLRLCGWAALRICVDLFRLVQATTRTRVRRTGLVRLMRDWAVPLGLGGLFVLLFLNANPVLEVWGQALTRWSPQIHIDPGRAVFWGLAGALIWPFLRLDRLRTKLQGPARVRAPVALPDALFNPRSVLRALLTFNLIFALQTGLDLAFLWGGVSLPAGMTFATYAHKGAYPLVATALLAGGFALIAQPFLPGRPVLRGLLFLWTVQNILLVISSILRLDLYVETYGLTRLRFAAFVWMGLVVVK